MNLLSRIYEEGFNKKVAIVYIMVPKIVAQQLVPITQIVVGLSGCSVS